MVAENQVVSAHRHSSNHRGDILSSEQCGCFYCLSIFSPSEIVEWVDEADGAGTTAICPFCSIDSVIGTKSGFPVTKDFLGAMKAHWF